MITESRKQQKNQSERSNDLFSITHFKKCMQFPRFQINPLSNPTDEVNLLQYRHVLV